MKPHIDRWLEKFGERCQIDAEGRSICSGLDLSEAEALLDWLEAHGFTRREVSLAEGEKFTVRWQR